MWSLLQILKRHFYWLVFILLEWVSLQLFFSSHSYQASIVFSSFIETQGRLDKGSQSIRELFTLREANDALQKENARLKQMVSTSYVEKGSSQVLVRKDTSLRRLFSYLSARVVYNSTHLRNNYLILNLGKEEGVKPGMGVIAPRGVVGIVQSVSAHFCSVISVLHSQGRVTVRLAPTSYSGTLSWNGGRSDEAELSEIPSHVKVRLGQSVLTSGYSLAYPADIEIGHVVAFSKYESEDFQRLKVRFAQDFKTIDRVYVVKNLYREEMDALLAPLKEEGDENASE